MQLSNLLTVLLSSLAIAAPVGSRTDSALVPRQNAGSTSTSTTNNSGLLGALGLTGGAFAMSMRKSAAAAAEDGSSTSSSSTSECNLIDCTSGSSGAGPNGTSSSSSSSGGAAAAAAPTTGS
ncbi:hypothetical protein LTR15_007282 [Elasticomyces elasticus]|nr:hypothetical protein LTR15_007282 [Elasticomyces elasticus]